MKPLRPLCRLLAVLVLLPLAAVALAFVALLGLVCSPVILFCTVRDLRREATNSGWEDENS